MYSSSLQLKHLLHEGFPVQSVVVTNYSWWAIISTSCSDCMRVVYFISALYEQGTGQFLVSFKLFLTVLFVLCTYDTHNSAAKPMCHPCIDIVVLPVD